MAMVNTTFPQPPDELRSQSSSHHEHGHGHLALILAHILLALWAWLANVAQVVNLVLDPKLRQQPRSVLIISISVSELMMAGFLCPLYTDSLIRGPWRHGLLLCSMYEVIFYLQVCVSSLAVLVLNMERIYFLLAPRLLQAPAMRHVTALLTALPWLVSLLVVIPLYTRGARASLVHVRVTGRGLPQDDDTCVVEWDRTLHIVTIFVSFLAPSFLLLATAVGVLLLYVMSRPGHHDVVKTSAEPRTAPPPDPQWLHSVSEDEVVGGGGRRSGRRARHFSGLQEVPARTQRECVKAVCASTFLSVGLQFPFFALLLLQQFCQHPAQPLDQSTTTTHDLQSDQPPMFYRSTTDAVQSSHSVSGDTGSCQFSDTAWLTSMLLAMLKPGLLPLVWLFYSDIRAGFSPKVCVCSRRRFRTRRRREEETPDPACSSVSSLASQMTTI